MILLSTSSLAGYGLHRIFLLAKQGRYDGIDLSVDFGEYDSYDSEYLDSLMELTDIRIMSITAPERKITKKQCDMILMLAQTLGVETVSFHPPHRLDKDREWFGEYLQTLVAKYPSITINIVNAPPKTWLFVISEYGDARPETIKKITGHTALSIANVDPESGVDLMKTFVLLGSTMNLIYLSDKGDSESKIFPGEGTMPLESLLIKLRDVGYTGNFTISVSPHALMVGEDTSEVIQKMEESRAFIARYFS